MREGINLYQLAYHCAEFSDRGCKIDCNQCPYNISVYTDEPTATAIKANAYANYFNLKQMKKQQAASDTGSYIGAILFVVLVFGLIAYGCSSVKSCVMPADPIADVNSTRTGRTALLNVDEAVQRVLATPNTLSNVPIILQILQQQGVRDRNRDGKVNCIDYSITFRELYGSNARLIINKNPRTGMNHMFIELWSFDTGYIYVEPQGTPDWYSMGLVWGMQYNSAYNNDVTSDWGMIVGGM